MNYIKELNAFKDWVQVNELSANATLLWHTLMMINNTTGWKKQFNAPNALVGNLSGLSVQKINEARKQLMEHQLITCENGKKGKAPVYGIISFFNTTEQFSEQSSEQSRNILKHKQKESKVRGREETREEQLVTIYEENIGKLSPLARDEFHSWFEIIGEGLLLEAIKLTSKHDGRTFSYLEKILQEWQAANIKTVEALRDCERQKRISKVSAIPFRKQQAVGKLSVFDELRAEAGLL
ncbi:DnaD domain protein [Virgibacillus necropolis]|uniref:DnaD domain-containing protein n=1 Tax=Virgibacillus necropolis TaxID=163877 RepID=UPI00384F8617